jgi:poly(A) polymerase
MALSRERIAGELSKLLGVTDPVPTLRVMLANAILRGVLPEIVDDGADRLAALVAIEPTPAWVRRLAALLPVDSEVLDKVAYRLKLSNANRRRLVATADRLAPGADVWRAAYVDGAEAVIDRLLLDGKAAGELIAQLADWTRPVLPASGRDLIARGVAVGPEVSRRLALFESAWIDAGFPMDGATVDALLGAAAC